MNFNIALKLSGIQALMNGLNQARYLVGLLSYANRAGSFNAGGAAGGLARIGFNLGPFNPFIAQMRSFLLIKDMFGQLGPGFAALGSKLVAFALALRTAIGIVEVALSSARTLTEWVVGAAKLGTGGRRFTLMSGLLGAAGINDAVAFGHELRNRIATDPFAMTEAARFGIRAFPRGFGGTTNEGAITLKEIQILRSFRTEAEALDHALKMGTEDLLFWRGSGMNMLFEQFRQAAQYRYELFGQDQVDAAKELTGQMALLHYWWTTFTTAIGSFFIPLLTDFVIGLNVIIRSLGLISPGHKGALSDDMGQALRSNTSSVNDNTRALNKFHRQVFGGTQASHAIPPALRGQTLEWALGNQAVKLGAMRY